MDWEILLIGLAAGWTLDLLAGDPLWMPHPVVWMGKAIAFMERMLNHGLHRVAKGAVASVGLVAIAYVLCGAVLLLLAPWPWAETVFCTVMVFFCLAGTTLTREVGAVFDALDRSIDDGRRQVARIVGRDTASLSDQEVATAALETLAENLSDGVVAPLFWFAILGVPGMVAYKMVNTLDSMIGYRNDRFRSFGRVAARIDDVANWIPARLTAALIILAAGRPDLWRFVLRFGRCHASPNSGWPEAAMAGVLGCRFGGTHDYFGVAVYKPYIGIDSRPVGRIDAVRAIRVARRAEFMAVVLVGFTIVAISFIA
ncbi:adenosylcobinamide-phosphate synthase CbiB [Paramuribaculum intestinale]|uniref:adenosylcobinamide-phosphate synthase CbiB n=1 Tax=Paramuribaculum intestinale TaxID=2094151 RepID=UPI0025B6470B|nr:adenosylcobinamide-phosphate synthase CbiB [Paramuribaculum intestinale]